MKLKFATQRDTAEWMQHSLVEDEESMQFASAVHPRRKGPYPDYTGKQRLEPLRHQSVRRIPPPAHLKKAMRPRNGVVTRVLAWLRGNVAPEKKLRVLETVQLGEKRLVAIVEAQGRRFLVGCGSNGVSLLTSLEQEPERVRAMESLPFAGMAG